MPGDLDPDLFATAAAPELQFEGTLAEPPALRTRPANGQGQPVLCLLLRDVGPGLHAVQVHMPYAEPQRKAVEALAAALRPGQRVAVTSPASGLRLTLTLASSITPATPS